jgi:ferric-dicitrate binding protein FerR (iron transport regulator)
MRTRIARKLLHAALAVVCLAPGLWAQKKAGQVTRQIQPAQVQRSQAAAAAARPAGAGGIVPKITPVAATDKMPIYYEDKLITGDGGRMRAQLEDGSILSLGQKSELLVREHNARTQQSSLQLSYGQVRAQVVKLSRPDSKFEIRTNTAICGVLGTDEYIEASTPFSTLVLNMSDPNSRGQVEVRNSDARVTGMVVLNPGQATVVDQGKPPAGARQASGVEVNRAQQETTTGDQPIATPILQVTSGTVSPGDTPTAQIEAGAQLTLDARLSTAGASSFTGFLWQIPRRGFRSNEPLLVVNTTDWAPGSYEGTLTVTTVQNRTASSRFAIVVAPSLAGRAAPDEAIQALARAYESLQVSQFLSYFDQQNYSGYASLEQTVNQSFANIAENRVLVRNVNGTISGNTAIYQVEFEIRFLPKTSALPQSGVPGMSPSASAPPMLVPMRSGVRAAATASISGNVGAVATFVTLSSLDITLKLFVNTGTGMTYSFKDLPPGKYMITPSRNGFAFNPPSRTVDLTETGLTGVDFTAAALTQVVRETVTVQMQYMPNASWHIRNLSGPIGSAGLVGVPGVGNPDKGGDAPGSGGDTVAVADFKVTAAPQNLPPIARGGGGTPVTVTIDPVNGFKGTVTVSWTAGAGITVTPATQAVAVTSGAATQTFTVSAGANAALGNTGIQFLAASGNIKKQGSNTVTVYGLTLAQAGPAVSIFAGGFTAPLTVLVTTAPGVTTPITVSASGTGITSSTATVNGNGAATLTLTTSGPDTGATTVTVTASGTGLPSTTLAVPVTRVAPFSLSGGGAVSFVAGEKGSVSFGVTLAASFSGPVVVTAPTIGGLTFSRRPSR